jgi:hypothetical protein
MDKESIVYIHNEVLFSHKKNEIIANSGKMNGTRNCHVKQSKTSSEGQRSHVPPCMMNLDLVYYIYRHTYKNMTIIKGILVGHGGDGRKR